MNARLEVQVYGLVQGVFFRHHTKLQAEALHLSGTVENRPDGTVYVVAEGARADLEALLAWLAHGPELARVERVDVQWDNSPQGHVEFSVVR
jgi:acylphosphatase